MADTTDGGWFSYRPGDPTSWDRLSDEQRDAVIRHRDELAERVPTCEERILFQDLQPGHAELRFGPAPDGTTTADVLRAAIRELESTLALFAG